MKPNTTIILAALITLGTIAGCKSTRDAEKTLPGEVQENAESETSRCPNRYMTRTFNCTAAGYNANGLIRMECEKTLWMNINKGVELGRIKMTSDSIWIHVKIFNCAWKGNYKDLERLVHQNYHFDTLMDQLVRKPEEAAASMSEIGESFNIPFTIAFGELKSSDELTFPLNIPPNAKPLEILLSQ